MPNIFFQPVALCFSFLFNFYKSPRSLICNDTRCCIPICRACSSQRPQATAFAGSGRAGTITTLQPPFCHSHFLLISYDPLFHASCLTISGKFWTRPTREILFTSTFSLTSTPGIVTPIDVALVSSSLTVKRGLPSLRTHILTRVPLSHCVISLGPKTSLLTSTSDPTANMSIDATVAKKAIDDARTHTPRRATRR